MAENNSSEQLYQLLTEIDKKVTRLETMMAQIEKQQDGFVTRAEFEPVKKLVYGVIGLVMTGVVTTVLALVIRTA